MLEPTKSRNDAAAAPARPAAPAALSRFLDHARALEAEQVLPMRADARVAQHNVGLGVAAVMTWADHVREHLPHVDLEELRSLPDLALCLAHACDDVLGAEPTEAPALLAEAHALRRVLGAVALALAEAGVLSAKDAARWKGERGAVDAGADCLALAALFEKRAEEIAGQSPVTEEQIARAAELGATLRSLLKPKAAAKRAGTMDVRDRLWTLLVARHERLWAVGAYVFGHAVDEHVPSLYAPIAKAKRTAKGGAS